MSTAYIICCILLGIAGIANLVAMVYLFRLILFCRNNPYKFHAADFTIQLFIREPILNIDADGRVLNRRESREQDKTADNGKAGDLDRRI